MRGALILFVVVILAINGCAEKVDLEAEKAQVQSVLDQWVQAVETEDIDLYMKTFAKDADMVTFGTAAADRWVGWEPLREHATEVFQAFDDIDLSFRDIVIKVHASGKVAWFSLIFDETWVAQEEPGSLEGGRLTGVLEKRDGNWVVVQFHASMPVAEEEVEN